ncbi:MAG: aspartate kinase [Bacteroidota bacterium]
MKVLKFGGASVQDAEAVRNLALIIKRFQQHNLVIVVSAMNKMTNNLESLLHSKMMQDDELRPKLENIADFHRKITRQLFPEDHIVFEKIDNLLQDLTTLSLQEPHYTYDKEYDRLVPYGELLSTTIIHAFLETQDIKNTFLDARQVIKTDANYRSAHVDLIQSEYLINSLFSSGEVEKSIITTQGFIGSDAQGQSTTLGREGSDFTAAIFASALNAEEVITWKDVPGLFNADPRLFNHAKKIEHISFRETIELAYYGAKIIHPNTIKPLYNKGIPLKIKSFINPEDDGSIINQDTKDDHQMESYIVKSDQVLISLLSSDYEFITETSLAYIFSKFASYNLKINLMQNSAITFTACVDHNEDKIASLILDLRSNYHIRYNENLELLTIRHFNDNIINELTHGRQILVEQRNRTTVQFIMK